MTIHYYLSIFPTEAIIASHLEPESFGVYMSTGAGRGSAEPVTFIELQGELPTFVDTAFAEAECASLSEGVAKRSMYLSIYRCLEHIPLDHLGTLYLVTRDGRSLPLEPERVEGNLTSKPVYLYHELCPIRPMIVSTLEPLSLIRHMTDPDQKIQVPRLALADLVVTDPEELDDSGNFGNPYGISNRHIRDCLSAVMENEGKMTKTLGRARLETFMYNLIDSGVYIGDAEGSLFYRMKSRNELTTHHYAWGKSAMAI